MRRAHSARPSSTSRSHASFTNHFAAHSCRPTLRRDAAHYLYLHEHGGIYADLNFLCLRSFEALLHAHEGAHSAQAREAAANVLLARIALHTTGRRRDGDVPNTVKNHAPAAPFWLLVLQARRALCVQRLAVARAGHRATAALARRVAPRGMTGGHPRKRLALVPDQLGRRGLARPRAAQRAHVDECRAPAAQHQRHKARGRARPARRKGRVPAVGLL